MRHLFLVVLCLLFAGSGYAEESPLQLRLVSETATFQPGTPIRIAIDATLSPKWHTYWKNPGETGIPTELDWQLPEGFKLISIQWPAPKKIEEQDMVYYGYDGEFIILAELLPSENSSSSERIGVTMRWLACNDENCLPGDTDAELTLQSSKSPPKPNSKTQALFSKARQALPKNIKTIKARKDATGIELCLEPDENCPETIVAAHFAAEEADQIDPRTKVSISHPHKDAIKLHISHNGAPLPSLKGLLLIQKSDDSKDLDAIVIDVPIDETLSELEYSFSTLLLFAFLGGMILNLMPCVLPVISFKVMSLIKLTGEERSKTLFHGLTFAAGVLAAFWFLSGLLIILKAYGQSVGWGFQLQDPRFIAFLAALMLAMGLSLFGLFEIGTSLSSWAGQQEGSIKQQSGLTASFLSGILATLVATPCSGPFLGTALGATILLPPFSALLVFTFVGIGMALPFVILTAYPSMMKWLPKPGPWLGTFKQLMGFLLLATALWLIWVFSVQTDASATIELLTGLLILSFALWIYGTFASPLRPKRHRILATIMTCMIAFFGLRLSYQSADTEQIAAVSTDGWQNYSRQALELARAEGKPVFVDYTAKWCMICQANHLVLVTGELEKQFQEKAVVRFKADLTRPNAEIQEDLHRFGRNSVPLYLLYLPDRKDPIILPQVLTADLILQHLEGL